MLGTTAAILLIGGAATAIKLRQRDIERTETETGKSADDPSEEQLLAAMKKLGIKKPELTEEDEAAVAEAAVAEAAIEEAGTENEERSLRPFGFSKGIAIASRIRRRLCGCVVSQSETQGSL